MSNRRRAARPLGRRRYAGSTEPHERRGPRTYWNGRPTPCGRGTAVVADAPIVRYWPRDEGLIGCRVPVVKVDHAVTVWLFDRDGEGWTKVTTGRGSPQWPHRTLVIEEGSYRAN